MLYEYVLSDFAMLYGIEGICNLLFRFLVEFAYDVNSKQREEEAGDDLIETKESELLPDQNGNAADEDAGKDAVPRSTAPEERHQKCRTKGGTEAGPGIGNHIEDEAVRIHGKCNGNGSDEKVRKECL